MISISKGVRRKSAFDNIHLQGGAKLETNSNITITFSHFIQEIRDETHRFAITLQKKKMRKSSIKSSIDDLQGVGLKRKQSLLRYFGSLDQIKRASLLDISNVEGIGDKVASMIYNQLH